MAEFDKVQYCFIIAMLNAIGFTNEEIKHGIEMLPDNASFELKALTIQVGQNALKWAREHEKN